MEGGVGGAGFTLGPREEPSLPTGWALAFLQWSVSERTCERPFPPAPLKSMGKEILGWTPPLSDGEWWRCFQFFSTLWPWHVKSGTPADLPMMKGARSGAELGGGAEVTEKQIEGGLLVRSWLNSAPSLHVSFFLLGLLESFESDLLLLSQSLLTNSKAMRHCPQVFTSLANILEPEKLPGF